MSGNHYVDNKKLTAELSEWVLQSRNGNTVPMPQFVAESILSICENIVKRPNFAQYTYRDDMVGDAIENCTKYVKNFNPDKSKNAFGYITQIAFTAIIRKIKKEKIRDVRHLKFIRDHADVDDLVSTISSEPEVERNHYNGYMDYLKGIIDDFDSIPADEKKSKNGNKERSILEELFETEGIPIS